MNVTELLTTIRTSTKQTKNTSKIIDLRGRLKTADHCGAVWRAGGKPSTWFPPGRLVEQSGVKEEGFTENNSKETDQKSNAKRQPKSTRAKQDMTN